MKKLLLVACLIVCLFHTCAAAGPLEYDVVVVGGGGAGLVAATAAAEQGASVIVLEKMSYLGGNTIRSGGVINAVNPELQKAQGIEDSTDLHFKHTYEGGDNKANPELVRTLVEGALPALQRALDRGLKIYPEITTATGALWPRTHRLVEPAGTGWIRVYSESAAKAGVEIRKDTKVVSLLREEPLAGRVYGVKAVDKAGNELEIHARRGVVMASGGFGADVKLRMQHNPTLGPDTPTTNHPGATGEGIIMSQDIGAAVTGMDFIQIHPHGDPKLGDLTGRASDFVQKYIYVNIEGKRFVNEAERRDVQVAGIIAQPETRMFIINDQNGVSDPNIFGDHLDELLAADRVQKGDTLAELAEKIGVPAAALEATVARYNELVKQGKDVDFGRPENTLQQTIETPPFYATPRVPTVHHTMGGLVINKEAQVIDRRGEVIPGLFAAGEVTGGIHGTNRLGGNAITDINVFGWIAGTNAAK